MSLTAYKGYYKNGHVIPLGNPFIPEGSEVIITILEPLNRKSPLHDNSNPQLEAMCRFCNGNRDCDEPIPEFNHSSFREMEI